MHSNSIDWSPLGCEWIIPIPVHGRCKRTRLSFYKSIQNVWLLSYAIQCISNRSDEVNKIQITLCTRQYNLLRPVAIDQSKKKERKKKTNEPVAITGIAVPTKRFVFDFKPKLRQPQQPATITRTHTHNQYISSFCMFFLCTNFRFVFFSSLLLHFNKSACVTTAHTYKIIMQTKKLHALFNQFVFFFVCCTLFHICLHSFVCCASLFARTSIIIAKIYLQKTKRWLVCACYGYIIC